MKQCKQCGATLPENSNVCLQCGTKNAPPRNDSEDTPHKELDFLKPALAGGAFLSVLTSLISFVSTKINLPLINISCCLWVLGGAAIAVYLLNQQRPGTLTYGDGALVGLFTGVFAAILSTLLGIPLKYLLRAELQRAIDQFQQQSAQMPPGVRDFVLQFMTPDFNMTAVLVGLVIGLITNAILMTACGALMVVIVNRKKTD